MNIDKEKIVLDCDPGHDDMMAILMAARSPRIEVLGITTVAGNQTLDNTHRNARSICALAALAGVQVYRGMEGPILRQQVTGRSHGASGLDGASLPESTAPEPGLHAVEYIIDTVRKHPGAVTLVPTGPLTNVAIALRKAPDLKQKIRRVVCMGGALRLGNITPAAEFNVYADPEAASIVFSAGLDLTIMPLDVTHQVMLTPERVRRIGALGSPAMVTVSLLLEWWLGSYQRNFGLTGAPLHDPCTIAYVTEPSMFEIRRLHVEIDTSPGPCYGRTVGDLAGVTGREPNVAVGLRVDEDRFFALLMETLAGY